MEHIRPHARPIPAIPSLDAFRRQHPPASLRMGPHEWTFLQLGTGAQVVLFLHGMAGAYDIWWQQMSALQDHMRVISVTYPAIPTLEGVAQSLLALLDHLSVARVFVVGSSLGGYYAQYLMARAPERLTGAVLGNTFPPNDRIARQNRVQGWLLPLLPSALIARMLRRNIEEQIYPAAGRSDVVRAYLLEQAEVMSKAQFLARFRCVVEPFTPPDPAALGLPVAIIEADNDPLVEPALRALLKQTYPQARVHTLHDVGHFPYLNRPDIYTRLVEEAVGRSRL